MVFCAFTVGRPDSANRLPQTPVSNLILAIFSGYQPARRCPKTSECNDWYLRASINRGVNKGWPKSLDPFSDSGKDGARKFRPEMKTGLNFSAPSFSRKYTARWSPKNLDSRFQARKRGTRKFRPKMETGLKFWARTSKQVSTFGPPFTRNIIWAK